MINWGSGWLYSCASYVKSYKPTEVPPFGVQWDHPYFATGMGGFLQALINGFGELDITPKGIIQLKTKLRAQ